MGVIFWKIHRERSKESQIAFAEASFYSRDRELTLYADPIASAQYRYIDPTPSTILNADP
jgi:hypothetical protein